MKRVYDQAESTDGFRVLVDHIWPRGISKEQAKLNLWLKEIAPSDELRKWYGHDSAKYNDFKKKYLHEIKNNTEASAKLREAIKSHAVVTLVYAAKASDISNAKVLLDYFK